ncbi:hypothetical protein A0H81_02086 [Grifola frondosa]|uniref:Uncharacterized protein n=1 Tax=Grifola frondosa TaxID=5627 RepID=A0A1C7ML21_GRIFR|nr:hypothetical protein A0H81_02086 [Grifola frondosa]
MGMMSASCDLFLRAVSLARNNATVLVLDHRHSTYSHLVLDRRNYTSASRLVSGDRRTSDTAGFSCPWCNSLVVRASLMAAPAWYRRVQRLGTDVAMRGGFGQAPLNPNLLNNSRMTVNTAGSSNETSDSGFAGEMIGEIISPETPVVAAAEPMTCEGGRR